MVFAPEGLQERSSRREPRGRRSAFGPCNDCV